MSVYKDILISTIVDKKIIMKRTALVFTRTY